LCDDLLGGSLLRRSIRKQIYSIYLPNIGHKDGTLGFKNSI
jgi:hypothetical protein